MRPTPRSLVGLFFAITLLLTADFAALALTTRDERRAKAAVAPTGAGARADDPGPGPPAVGGSASSTTPVDTTTGPRSPSGSDVRPATGQSQTTVTSPPPTYKDRMDLAFELLVSPSCATRGSTFTITIRTVPGARVSTGGIDAEGKRIGSPYAGPVGSDGSLTVELLVGPDAAPGRGSVSAIGTDLRGHAAQRRVPVEIAALAC